MRLLALGLAALSVSGATAAQDLSVPADPVAAIEGNWKGIWNEWEVNVTNGRVVLTKGDPKSYTWLPVGTVLGVLNNNGLVEERGFRFTGSTCLDHRRDLPPAQYKVIPCGKFGAVLSVYKDTYQLHISGISVQRPKDAAKVSTVSKPEAKPQRPSKPGESAESTAEARRRQSEEVAARNRAKQAQYEAEMKAWQDQIDAQKATEESKQAQFDAAKQAAAKRLAAFEAEQAAHRAQMEKHAQIVLENQAAQQRHALCTAGDRAACQAIAQGKPVAAPVAKDAGQASTDDDARQCVTEPVLSPNEAYKGSLKAVVINGCDKPVDVLICLMRTGGWNCGMTLGLKPQDDWTWWTMNPQDGVFWDARTSGSQRKLDRPAGA